MTPALMKYVTLKFNHQEQQNSEGKRSMSDTRPLDPQLTKRVLRRFGLPAQPPPTLETLRQLLERYTRNVPWESASRIVRRARHQSQDDCPLFAEAFWSNALAQGTGGTCYESNYAFFALLLRLGYTGYLTINNMGAAIGCHSAIIIWLDGRKHLVDVGLPLYAVLPLPALETTQTVTSPFFRYEVQATEADRYLIWRKPHPRALAFTLLDDPVAEADYRAITAHDYRQDGGQFLKEVVIHKVIAEQLWRFNGGDPPAHVQVFEPGEQRSQRRNQPLTGDVAGALAAIFGMDRGILGAALRTTEN